MRTRILITGSRGQLANEFISVLKQSKYEVIFPDESQLDITEKKAIFNAVQVHRPDIILNCAAYNLVDEAESNFDGALKVNAEGVKNLAEACRNQKILLVHYSTDAVFDGKKEDFYLETDEPKPINNYGRSKLRGEEFLKEIGGNFLLFRVSWVFGPGGQNFLYKLMELTKEKRFLRVVCDQVSVPTYTEDIVRFTILAIEKGLKGLFHLTNSGYASKYELARYFFEQINQSKIILPVASGYFSDLAKRPYFSAMANYKLSKELHISIPDWKNAINRFIKRIKLD